MLVTSNIYGYSPSGDPEKGRDVVFVVPVSIRKADRGNAAPQMTGPTEVTGEPGNYAQNRYPKRPDIDHLNNFIRQTGH